MRLPRSLRFEQAQLRLLDFCLVQVMRLRVLMLVSSDILIRVLLALFQRHFRNLRLLVLVTWLEFIFVSLNVPNSRGGVTCQSSIGLRSANVFTRLASIAACCTSATNLVLLGPALLRSRKVIPAE